MRDKELVYALELPTQRFKLLAKDGQARFGEFATIHGTFQTPQFMPVGTRASVKGIDVERLQQIGAQIILTNTYHLWLRPTAQVVRDLGGIHKFSGWPGPILSDSGGYQIFSLRGIRELTEQGVTFRSHIDGARCFLSPELAIQIQETLGVDIAMVLDECPAAGLSRDAVAESLEMTLRWAARSLNARSDARTAVFGITQGGNFADLRQNAAQAIAELPFDGFAIGGLSVGEAKEVMYEVLSYHVAQLPESKIRYLMGVGTPQDILQAVYHGVDLFDCVMPTRAGRFGRAFVSAAAQTQEPFLNIRNAQYASDSRPLDEGCSRICCRNYSRGYLHHLFKVDEMLGPILLSLHNLGHYMDLMRRIRESIHAGIFMSLYNSEMSRWKTPGVQAESAHISGIEADDVEV